jgi:hypothetical protein
MSKTAKFSVNELLKQDQELVGPSLMAQSQQADFMKMIVENNKQQANMNTINNMMMKNLYAKLLENNSQTNGTPAGALVNPAFPDFPQIPGSAAFLSPFFFNNMNSQLLQQSQQQQQALNSARPNLPILNEFNKAAQISKDEKSNQGGMARNESQSGAAEDDELKSSDYEDDNEEFGNDDGLDSHYGSAGENDYDDDNNNDNDSEDAKPNGMGSKKRKRRILFTKHQTYELEKRFRQQR